MVNFRFNSPPYAECNGNWYSIGDTIEEPVGTPVIFYGDIERIANGATREEAQLVVGWDSYVQGTSEFFWFSVGESWALLTGEVPIPDSEKDAAFYVFPRGDTVQHDPRCCITLKPTKTCSQQFYLEDIDAGTYITGATVKVGGVECEHEYPSIERYQKDDLVEGSWYNVVASKSGYTCPSDICKDTFEACGNAITLKLKKTTEYVDFRIRVLDDITLQPINNAYVDLTVGSDYTDANGYTQWWTVESGVLITGTITASGYEDGTVSITSLADATWNQYLVPEVVTCDQLVKVVDKDTGAGIEDVTVAARPVTGTIIRCTTDSLGKCTLEGLIEGDDYRLVVETYPAGWECQYTVDCEEDITACETERTFRLKWTEPITCDQPVKVVDKDTPTEGIEGVTVAAWQSGARVKDCTTGSDGKCTISALNRDQMYDIKVESYPAGWECEYTADCEYNMQMACDPEITFKLIESLLPSLILVPTLTTITLDESLCPEVECESGIDDVCIYIDGVKTTNCANSGIKANIRCKTLIYHNDFDKISGASLGVGTHTLQAKSPNAAESNIVDIAVTEPELYIESCNPTEISNGTYGTGFTDLTFNATAKNNTSAHAYIFFRLTRKGGVSVLDKEPDSQALPPFYIGADDTQDVVLGVPSIQETFVTLKDEWIRVDLWQSNINWGDKKLVDSVEIKVGDPDAPPDDEESIWKTIADLLGLTVPQVKAIVMAGGGLLALSFILPLLKR